MVLNEKMQQAYARGDIRLSEKQEELVRKLLFRDYTNTASNGEHPPIPPARISKDNGPEKREQIAEIEEMLHRFYPLEWSILQPIDESDLAEDFRDLKSYGRLQRLGMFYQKTSDLKRDTEKFNLSVDNVRGNIKSQSIFHIEQNLEKIVELIVRLEPQLKELERLKDYGDKLKDQVYHQGASALPKGLDRKDLSQIRTDISYRLALLDSVKDLMETKSELYHTIATVFYHSKQHPKRRHH